MRFARLPSRYIYGTTGLGDESLPLGDRLAVAQKAMEADVWLHTSHQYGEAQSVLRKAADLTELMMPPVICKSGWESLEQVREQVVLQNNALGIQSMAIGQLCLGGPMAESLGNGTPLFENVLKLREEGIVDRFVLEVWPWNSELVLQGLEKGRLGEILDGFIFYCNPLQRFVTNSLWAAIQAHHIPFIAMRTVAGGSLRRLIENENAPAYLKSRAADLLPTFEASGIENWTDFCVRFAASLPLAQATVGSTARAANLDEFLRFSKDAAPLEAVTLDAIFELQGRWSDEHDRFAEPWSM